MKELLVLLTTLLLFSCQATTHDKPDKEKKKKADIEQISNTGETFNVIAQLPKKLKEISGIAKDGNYIWAISDDPKAGIDRLDVSGKVIQQVKLKDIAVTDVEDITVDDNFLYIADMGDNDGSRKERRIIRVKKTAIGSKEKTEVAGEIIAFTFPGWNEAKKKEDNQYDAEAIISYGSALYIFTKRRNGEQTELLMLPKTPGNHVATSIATFNSKGLITGAAINESGNEIALCGYKENHRQPFIWLLTGFHGDNFFSGEQQLYVLTDKNKDWQVEGITFKGNQTLLFSCEETKDEAATLYSISKSVLSKNINGKN